MCGLWVSLGINVNTHVISLVQHRGPDHQGWDEFSTPLGPLYMGHRRLSIIDLEAAANQPLQSEDGHFAIVYNGEIYNYLDLRQQLKQRGHHFRTRSDTEVLLVAYQEWGIGCLEKLAGMFAFVIYDKKNQKLFCARDRFGIKPLYFTQIENGVAFASEIKQLLLIPSVKRKINTIRAYDFLSSAIFDHTEETFFEDIHQMRGGEYFDFYLEESFSKNFKSLKKTWYSLPKPEIRIFNKKEATQEFYTLFERSIKEHLHSDVTVGSCLSGGLDSSSIVCLATNLLRIENPNIQMNLVSACSDIPSADERKYIAHILQKTKNLSRFVLPTPERLKDDIDLITWHQDEPFGSTSIFAQWCVFKTAGSLGLKVMLDGQGADELLAGYHGMLTTYYKSLYSNKQFVELFLNLLNTNSRKHLSSLLKNKAINLFSKFSRSAGFVSTIPSFLSVLNKDVLHFHQSGYSAFREAFKADGLYNIQSIGDLCYTFTKSTNLPALLHFEDRNSMAHSVEGRVPFLDHRLVEFCISLGSSFKTVNGQTKTILRNSMKDVLPLQVRKRQNKLGFATPEEIWFKGPLKPWVIDKVKEAGDTLNSYFEPHLLVKYTQEALDNKRPFDMAIWRVISLGLWAKIFNVSQ